MKKTLLACLRSMRFRTLPLSMAGIVMGIGAAARVGEVHFSVALWVILTACALQILSNLSNELGDTLRGTDTADRQGIHYSLQDGEMTIAQMKKLIAFILVVCCVFGLSMIYTSFGTLWAVEPLCFVLLGVAAILAAMKYTLGKNPYGYRGLGDISVFLFFGLSTVLGAFYLCSHSLQLFPVILPAIAIGFFSVGVLNVNNIRDMKTDVRTRTTVAIRLGLHRARIYQTLLLTLGWILMIVFTILTGKNLLSWLYIFSLPFFIVHIYGVWTKEDKDLDTIFPVLVLGTFFLSLLSAIFP